MDEELKNVILQAEQGNIKAMTIAGDCFLRGIFTDKDEEKAHFYYKMAADAGDAKTSLTMAIYLYNKDKKSSMKYLQYAADHGVAHAQYMLGLLYSSGEIGFWGRKQKAMKYFEMSARQGVAKAQIELFDMIVKTKSSKYTLDDMIFWLVCVYLHTSENDAEEREIAVKQLNHLIDAGMPGGKNRVDEVIKSVKRNYPQYLITPPPID